MVLSLRVLFVHMPCSCASVLRAIICIDLFLTIVLQKKLWSAEKQNWTKRIYIAYTIVWPVYCTAFGIGAAKDIGNSAGLIALSPVLVFLLCACLDVNRRLALVSAVTTLACLEYDQLECTHEHNHRHLSNSCDSGHRNSVPSMGLFMLCVNVSSLQFHICYSVRRSQLYVKSSRQQASPWRRYAQHTRLMIFALISLCTFASFSTFLLYSDQYSSKAAASLAQW